MWALSGTASKFLFAGGITPIELVQFRAAGSAVLLAIGMGLWKPSSLKIVMGDCAYLFILGALLAVTQFTYLFAISKTLVAVAILLQYQAPVVVALYALIFLRERLAGTTVVAIACSAIGCYLAVGAYNVGIFTQDKMGILSGLCSAVAFALYTVKSEYGFRRYSPWTVVLYALIVAAIIWNTIHPPFNALSRPHSLGTWWRILFVTVFGTLVPFGFYNVGIKRIRPAHAAITATLEPIAAAIVSFIFLGEMLEGRQILGAILVVGAIILLQIDRGKERGTR